MGVRVQREGRGHRLVGEGPITNLGNRYLAHLEARQFSRATVRAYAFDLLCLSRFLSDRAIQLRDVMAMDLFDWLEWQARRPEGLVGGQVVDLDQRRGAAAATMNRRVAAARGLFEFAVINGVRVDNPVPSPRRSTGLRARSEGMLGHLARSRRPRPGGRLVRQTRPLPESLEADEINAFLADMETHRDRALVLAMALGGLRAAEVRGLLLADVDMGLRQLRVQGKGGRERIVPVDRTFFAECAAYLRAERPTGCATPECFVVLRGPTRGEPLTEAGLRKIFRVHRERSGSERVRPHRLRHTYGTTLATAGIDLLALRELMGHANPETTAAYVHLSPATLAAEYIRARERAGR